MTMYAMKRLELSLWAGVFVGAFMFALGLFWEPASSTTTLGLVVAVSSLVFASILGRVNRTMRVAEETKFWWRRAKGESR